MITQNQKDAELHPDLADIIQSFRSMYEDLLENPSTRDIKATLRALAKADDTEVSQAIKLIDNSTECELLRGEYQIFKAKHPSGEFKDSNFKCPPDLIREAAAEALRSMPKQTGGAPGIAEIDNYFAQNLVGYWIKSTKSKPTINNRGVKLSPFQNFAAGMFERVGRTSNRKKKDCIPTKRSPLADLYRILRKAIKAEKEKGFWPF